MYEQYNNERRTKGKTNEELIQYICELRYKLSVARGIITDIHSVLNLDSVLNVLSETAD